MKQDFPDWFNSLSDEQKLNFVKALDKAAEGPPVRVKTRDLPSRKEKKNE